MKQITKRGLAWMLAVSMMVPPCGTTAVQAAGESSSGEDAQSGSSYIVSGINQEECDCIIDEYGDDETPSRVKESGTLFLNLTESEKESLEEKYHVSVTEDSVVTASGKTEISSFAEAAEISIDPDEQWNLNMISATPEEITESSSDLSKIKVAVLDSGVSYTTDVVVDRYVNLVPDEEDVLPFYTDVTGHGTSVAGVIGAQNNGEGTTGVNPDATLYSVRVLDDTNQAPVSRVIEGIEWCIDNDVNIVNMSFGMDSYNEAFHEAIKAADEAGILLIAAAGNENGTVQYPAAFPEVMSVGSVDTQGQSSDASIDNEEIDILAPGERIPSVGFLDCVVETQGTSMSAPHVAGAAAALWAKNPEKSADFIRSLLTESTREPENATDKTAGVLDLAYAMENFDTAEEPEDGEEAVVIPENQQPVQSFDDDYVAASWSSDDHVAAIEKDYVNSDKRSDLPEDMILYVKIGIKWADMSDVLKNKTSEGDDSRKALHGKLNYIANTIYLARIAQKTETLGMSAGIEDAEYPIENATDENLTVNKKGKNQIKTVLTNFNTTAMWNQALKDYDMTTSDLTSQRKAYFILGLSAHNAMDTYAHNSYFLYNGEWKSVKSVYKNGDGKENIPLRWSVAKKVAFTVLDRYSGVSQNEIDASVYYKPSYYDSIDFKLEKFSVYYNYCSSSLYQQHQDWIDARTYIK